MSAKLQEIAQNRFFLRQRENQPTPILETIDFLSLTIALEERFTQHHLTALCGYRRKAAQKIILMATFNVNIVTKRCTLVLS